MNKKNAIKTLCDFTRIVDKGFLVYGSALGAIREKQIIEHDLDVDVGIMQEDFSWAIVNNLLKDGFVIGRIFGSLACGLEIAFSKNEVKVDLMVIYRHGNRIWNSLWKNGGRNGFSDMIVHSYKPFDILTLEMNNKLFRCAGLDYITQVYGADWRTPVKNWNWRTGHHCIDEDLKNELRKIYG